jgi:hypothetical protein
MDEEGDDMDRSGGWTVDAIRGFLVDRCDGSLGSLPFESVGGLLPASASCLGGRVIAGAEAFRMASTVSGRPANRLPDSIVS